MPIQHETPHHGFRWPRAANPTTMPALFSPMNEDGDRQSGSQFLENDTEEGLWPLWVLLRNGTQKRENALDTPTSFRESATRLGARLRGRSPNH